MEQIILSNIELYSTKNKNIQSDHLTIDGDDVHHIAKVMRHKESDEIYVTDGDGNIYLIKISEILKNEIKGKILKTYRYTNELKNVTICLPLLKNHDRLEYALEKCTELGITNFIIYEAKRSTPKGMKIKRWEKLVHAAMKQSLQSFLPTISELNSFESLNELPGIKVMFEQNSDKSFVDFIIELESFQNENLILIFGPEGGLTEEEINSIDEKVICRLTMNRLRSETAITTAVSILSASLS